MPEYARAESVSIDLRMEALTVVVGWVREHYGDDAIALRNVASLVDGVADAVATDDRTSALVRGLRLLTEAQTVDLWHRLGGT
jgi:hypothetical protein